MPGPGKIAITVEAIWGETMSFYLKGSDTFTRLGEYYEHMKGITTEHYYLLFEGDRVRLERTVQECNIEEGAKLDLLIKQCGD